jgi:hypothetical protein
MNQGDLIMTSEQAAEARVKTALEKIESAQNLLSSACADLSAIIGSVPHWRRASKLSDRCHDAWRKLAYHPRTDWTLDSMHTV